MHVKFKISEFNIADRTEQIQTQRWAHFIILKTTKFQETVFSHDSFFQFEILWTFKSQNKWLFILMIETCTKCVTKEEKLIFGGDCWISPILLASAIVLRPRNRWVCHCG